MVEESSDPILAIAFEVHELVRLPGVHERYLQNLCECNKTRQARGAQRAKHNTRVVAQVFREEEPTGHLLGYSDDGPPPLYWNPPWSIPECYVATAIVHDLMLDKLRANITSHAVDPICPRERKFWWFRGLVAVTKELPVREEDDLSVRPMSEAITRVRNDLKAAGLLIAEGGEGAAETKSGPACDNPPDSTVEAGGPAGRSDQEAAGTDNKRTAKAGFLGGTALAIALEVPEARKNAFFQHLMRHRLELREHCQQVSNPTANSPKFIYSLDSVELRRLAAQYMKPKPG